MLAAIPALRAVAVGVCGRAEQADDLAQTAITKAFTNIDSFVPGTNMAVWLCSILHNQFRSKYRRCPRELVDVEGMPAGGMVSAHAQTWRALGALPLDQREALMLVRVSGFSYKQAAEICGCPIGTTKSRVSRAQTRLATILSIESVKDCDPNGPTWPASFANDSVQACT